jgi:conjugal transfer pilin signal peptidase TrbI
MLRLVWVAGKSTWAHLRDLPVQAATALGGSTGLEPSRPGRLVWACAIILPIGLLTWSTLRQITLVVTPSINALIVREKPGPIRRGDLVSFKLMHPLAGPKPVDVTKVALCMPGDRIDLVERRSSRLGATEGRYYCNGMLLGVSKPLGLKGQPLDPWKPSFKRLPVGMIYVGSMHPNGFDSRYYGPVAQSRLRRMKRVL